MLYTGFLGIEGNEYFPNGKSKLGVGVDVGEDDFFAIVLAARLFFDSKKTEIIIAVIKIKMEEIITDFG